jgi:transposase
LFWRLSLSGKRNDRIASELGLRPHVVGCWRRRFADGGIEGLKDAPRSGKPPKYGEPLRNRLLSQLEQPPAGMSGWDGASLAKALGVSDDAVWRALRKEGIQLQRHRSWCVSTDPEFAAKAADVIGLYLNPPQNALVLSVNEKPSIQALERTRGYVHTSSGKIVRGMKSTYQRHGTVNLFAALEVATGTIRGKTTQTKKRTDFQAFMDDIVAEQPETRQIHVILDNLNTHKKNDDWLAAHPNVTFHFTPTSASWLISGRNLVWHLSAKDAQERKFWQHRPVMRGHSCVCRCLQRKRRPLRMAQTRSSGRTAS